MGVMRVCLVVVALTAPAFAGGIEVEAPDKTPAVVLTKKPAKKPITLGPLDVKGMREVPLLLTVPRDPTVKRTIETARDPVAEALDGAKAGR